MGITVLGPLTVDGCRQRESAGPGGPGGAGGARRVNRCATEELVDALWGDTPPASAAKILQGCVVRLRKVLGTDAIETSAHGYLLDVPPDQLDSQRFERLVVRARELLGPGRGRPGGVPADRGAVPVARGGRSRTSRSGQPAAAEARRLAELRLEAEELRVDALLRAGRHAEVLAEVQALVRGGAPARAPLGAAGPRAVPGRAAGRGAPDPAPAQVGARHQAGGGPGPDVLALEQAILRQDPSLLAGGSS